MDLNETACLIKKGFWDQKQNHLIIIFVHIYYKPSKFSFQIKALNYKVEKRDTNRCYMFLRISTNWKENALQNQLALLVIL